MAEKAPQVSAPESTAAEDTSTHDDFNTLDEYLESRPEATTQEEKDILASREQMSAESKLEDLSDSELLDLMHDADKAGDAAAKKEADALLEKRLESVSAKDAILLAKKAEQNGNSSTVSLLEGKLKESLEQKLKDNKISEESLKSHMAFFNEQVHGKEATAESLLGELSVAAGEVREKLQQFNENRQSGDIDPYAMLEAIAQLDKEKKNLSKASQGEINKILFGSNDKSDMMSVRKALAAEVELREQEAEVEADTQEMDALPQEDLNAMAQGIANSFDRSTAVESDAGNLATVESVTEALNDQADETEETKEKKKRKKSIMRKIGAAAMRFFGFSRGNTQEKSAKELLSSEKSVGEQEAENTVEDQQEEERKREAKYAEFRAQQEKNQKDPEVEKRDADRPSMKDLTEEEREAKYAEFRAQQKARQEEERKREAKYAEFRAQQEKNQKDPEVEKRDADRPSMKDLTEEEREAKYAAFRAQQEKNRKEQTDER